MAASKSKVETLTFKPSQVTAAIDCISRTKVSLFIWGPPGIGKSANCREVATNHGIAFIDVRLSQMDPTDIRGIPIPVTDDVGDDGVRWSAPVVFPRDLEVEAVRSIDAIETTVKFRNPKGANKIYYVTKPKVTVTPLDDSLTAEFAVHDTLLDRFVVVLKDSKGAKVAGKFKYTVTGDAHAILALDEFNAAPQSVQAASYQLVLDRALGEYEVPDNVVLIGMGNRETDKGIAYKMPTPIMNRFDHLEMRADFDDWQRWALSAYVNAEVIGFLSAFKNKLFEFEPGSAARGFATPRSWTFVSDILNANDDMNEEVAIGLVTGCVGDAAGLEFMEFRKIAADLPHAEAILNGSLTAMKGRVEPALSYALTTTLCYELKERADSVRRMYPDQTKWANSPERKRWMVEADNFLEFIMKNFQPEICIMGAKAAISVHKLPFDTIKMKHFDTFAGKFRDLIMN